MSNASKHTRRLPRCLELFFRTALAFVSVLYVSVSCRKTEPSAPEPSFPEEIDNVLVIYAAGKNNLAGDIRTNIEDFCKGYLPAGGDRNILLIYSRLSSSYNPCPSYLERAYMYQGRIVRDTVRTYADDRNAADADMLSEVLSDARELFPGKGYGLLFSSHATGWLPAGYYGNSDKYDRLMSAGSARYSSGQLPIPGLPEGSVPYVELPYDPSRPMVKSIGQDRMSSNGSSLSYEIDLNDFAEAIPMHLDYIFFDCCLMGGIETAYELKDKCDRIIFSPTEVLSTGFNYSTMGVQLLGGSQPDLVKVCSDYYDRYNAMSGDWKSATVTLIDCSRLEPLAEACRLIFSNHREALDQLTGEGIQQYFQYNYHWFYDLRDIAVKAGASRMELDLLDSVLDNCIIYKAATERFITFPINTYSGLSMYLPGNGSAYLDNFYRNLKWNQATGLVSE